MLFRSDLANPVVLVPCSLTITGDPIIALSDSCVDFGQTMQFLPVTQTLNVINNGCDTLMISSITSNSPQFTILAPFTYLVPGASGAVTVRFQSSTVGSFSGLISILNNDVDTTVCLNAITYPAPDVNAAPNSVTTNLPACGATTTQTFNVENQGGTDLTYSVSGLPSWASATNTGDTVAPGTSQTVTLTFNSGTLAGGTYTANINVVSNDPLTPIITVACTLIVGGNPCMTFTQTSNTCTGQTNFVSSGINSPTSYL